MATKGEKPLTAQHKEGSSRAACHFCNATSKGRNLVVSFDGTSNRFGINNTNVVELYHRIIKDDNQLTYYNSGIGTYARPSWRSYTYWKHVLDNWIDLAIAWYQCRMSSLFTFIENLTFRNFEKILLAGYRWLSENYVHGDKIFVFGFSRGAYQARALAGMIKTVGLIFRGNEEQIPFAYELFADIRNFADSKKMADRFKATFCRRDVKIHFLGAWDTVSSVGMFRGKTLPLTNEINEDICYFRHALALDERRVKFLPEYVCGGISHNPMAGNAANAISTSPRIKEVWFAGCHSDIGGGVKSNEELNNATVPVLWMANEAWLAGLKLNPSGILWDWEELKVAKRTESLTLGWLLFEVIPFRRLMYAGGQSNTWWPHLAKGRVIQPGQKIHASVAFIRDYQSEATFGEGMRNEWRDIVNSGKQDNVEWTKAIKGILELDLFDHSEAKISIERFKLDASNIDVIRRLEFMALTVEGAQAIVNADPHLASFTQAISDGDNGLAESAIMLLSKIVVHSGFLILLAVLVADRDKEFLFTQTDIFETEPLIFLISSEDERREIVPHLEQWGTLINLASIFSAQYNRRRQLSDITNVVQLCRQALELLPAADPHWPILLDKLASALQIKFLRFGQLDDINEAILRFEKAVELTDDGHRDKPAYLNKLGISSIHRFMRTIKLDDFDKAISTYKYAERLAPDDRSGNRSRLNGVWMSLLFGSAMDTHQMRLSNDREKYIVELGHSDGVVQGTLFAVRALDTSTSSYIGIFEADSVDAHACTLRRRSQDAEVPADATASVLNWTQDRNILKVWMDLPSIQLESVKRDFSLVNSANIADLVIRGTSGGLLQFERLDPLMSTYTPVLTNIELDTRLGDILSGISIFNFHLFRQNNVNPLKQDVEVVLHRLQCVNPDEISEEAIYFPDGLVDIPLVLDRENVVLASGNFDQIFYGLTVKNSSGRNLFPYLVYFDPSDYSIQSWYHPPAAAMTAPLAARKEGVISKLPIGYGSEAEAMAFEFTLPDGATSDVGFLKLFVSTTYVDMAVLEQSSPFIATRGLRRVIAPPLDLWDAWTYVIRTSET
ncbi:hypothetical protein PILCRDRAFT_14925 [Piloderma croceum F 1598]|uniref:T6SS Phospholipase effector Tle1-like catalytic domain-containing protein n=1 Tax=Piloderma croceum (strain F 1598) TaxID=765440 RepID=A0A0C3F1M3_PILCF|nr:hypothetical protein PILCRDRAFT_14925 [Piloderma croceum F 1598]